MSEKIVQLNEEVIKGQLKELVRGSVEETLNELLEAEAEKLTQAARYERNEQRQGYRSGHYNRNLTTTSGDVTLKVPKLCLLYTSKHYADSTNWDELMEEDEPEEKVSEAKKSTEAEASEPAEEIKEEQNQEDPQVKQAS